MALTDQDIQGIQKQVKPVSKDESKEIGDTIKVNIVDSEGNITGTKSYEIVNKTNGTTEALAVAPVVDGKTDYSQTAIVVAGTQPGLYESVKNAVEASGIFGLTDGRLTAQTEEIDQFYQETVKKLEVHKGTVSNMSGFSQSGPGVAKVGAKYQVPKITNFTDWAAAQAVKSGAFSKSELAYLKDHATVYSDSGKDLTYLDGGKGEIPYGKVVVVEGTQGLNNPIGDHDPKFFHIKGDKLDIDYYVKKGQFVSGMTKEQVIKVAKMKAKAAKGWDLKDPSTWSDSTDYRDYVKAYEATYGAFAKANKANSVDSRLSRAKTLQSQLKGTSGSKRILLRKELVKETASLARAKGESYKETVTSEIAKTKEQLQSDLSAFEKQIRNMSQYLSDAEVTDLLSELTLETVWDEEAETAALAESRQVSESLSQFSETISSGADRLAEVDQDAASLFM